MIQEGAKVKEKVCETKTLPIAKKNKNQQKKKKKHLELSKIKINRKEGRRKNN